MSCLMAAIMYAQCKGEDVRSGLIGNEAFAPEVGRFHRPKGG